MENSHHIRVLGVEALSKLPPIRSHHPPPTPHKDTTTTAATTITTSTIHLSRSLCRFLSLSLSLSLSL